MEKKTLYALVAAAVLGLAAFLTLRAPEKGQRSGPPPRPVAAFKAADVAHLELTNEKQETTTLEKKGDRWTLADGRAADAAGVKSVLDALEKLGFGDVVTESKDRYADLGVAEGKAQHLVAKGAAGTLADLWVGKAVGGFTMVRVAGKAEVWQASNLFPYTLNRDAKAWRDHMVVNDLGAADVETVTIEAGGATLVLAREGGGEKEKQVETVWKIQSSTGDAPRPGETLDQTTANGVVQSAVSLRAADFLDGKKPAEVGLDKPAVAVTLGGKKTVTLRLVPGTGDEVLVQRGDGDQIWSVKKYAVDRLLKRPVDYRDKTITKVTAADLASVDIAVGKDTMTLEKSGAGWKLKGGGAVDDAKAKLLVGAFDNLAGAAVVDDKDPQKTGLLKPSATATLHLANKSTIVLKVGTADPKHDGDYPVQKAGASDVLWVKKFAAERFMKKAADLAPGAPAPGPGQVKAAAALQKAGRQLPAK